MDYVLKEIVYLYLEKIGFAKQGGGYVYYSDHSVPDNVSFANYQRVMELVRQYGRYDSETP